MDSATSRRSVCDRVAPTFDMTPVVNASRILSGDISRSTGGGGARSKAALP
jgi:hypothetical protein